MVPWNESFSVSALTAQLGREIVDVIVESDGPPSWSLDASETGEGTKCPWVGVVEGTAGENDRETVTAQPRSQGKMRDPGSEVAASLCLVFTALVAPATATPDWCKGQ